MKRRRPREQIMKSKCVCETVNELKQKWKFILKSESDKTEISSSCATNDKWMYALTCLAPVSIKPFFHYKLSFSEFQFSSLKLKCHAFNAKKKWKKK